MATSFLAATTGQPPLAQHINQLLTTHPTQFIYTGTQQQFNTTAAAATTGTNNLWLAQQWNTQVAQTTLGYVVVALSTTVTSGAVLPPTNVSIYTDNAGAPGTAILTVQLTAEYANLGTGGVNTNTIVIPFPLTGLTAATNYWIVVQATASAGGQFTWFRTTAVSGASTSTNGTTWTAQGYGFIFTIFDQVIPTLGAKNPLVAVWEDNGQRWQVVRYNSLFEVINRAEFTTGQTSSGYNQGYRSLTYSNGLLQGAT